MIMQEIFNKVATHLLTQNAKAMAPDDGGACRYRYGSLRCAIGCLIPDELYGAHLEGRGIGVTDYDSATSVNRVLVKAKVLKRPLGEERKLRLLSVLQRMHDGVAVTSWRNRLAQIAEQYDLNTDALEGIK